MLSTLSALRVAALAGMALSGCDATPPAAPAPTAAEAEPAALRGESLALLLREPEPYARVRGLATLLPGLGPESAPEVQQALLTGMGGMGIAEFELLMRSWASRDPRAATAWAIGLTSPRFRPSAVDVAVELWARADPTKAVAELVYAAQGLDRELAQTVQHALVQGWFHSDRPGLERYIQGLGSGIQQQRSVLSYALALGRAEGSDSVMRWAEAIPGSDDRYRRAVYRQVSTALAWADPEAARRWCDAQCEGPYGASLRSAIVRTWLHNGDDMREVLEWVSRAPEGPSQTHALRTGFETWALQDREDALRWMAQKIAEGPEPWVRKLFGAYARQLAVISPAAAIEWAERIEADPAREEMQIRIARRWRRQDAAAAEAWLGRSSLSEPARDKARNLSAPDYLPEAPTP